MLNYYFLITNLKKIRRMGYLASISKPHVKPMWAWIATLICGISSAQAAPDEVLIPAPPSLSASSYLLVDPHSGKVIVEHQADQRLPPASLTKMMTSYLVEHELARGNLKLTDKVRISEKAWRAPGSRMFVREGTFVELNDLLKGIIIQSGNDASIAVAEHLAGSESSFADLMNQHANLLGMNNTHFVNSTGLPAENHYSSARDLSILAQHIILDYPEHYKVYSEKYFTYNEIRQANRNKLLWRDSSVDGLKTGHTEEAGFGLVASAKKGDMRLISVVMGTKSEEARAQESQKLLTYGFRYFDTRQLYQKYEVLNENRVWGGATEQVKLGLGEHLYVTIPRGQEENLSASLSISEVIKAPIQPGDELGKVIISLNDEVITEKPLIALNAVEEGGFVKKVWDNLVLFFLGIVSS